MAVCDDIDGIFDVIARGDAPNDAALWALIADQDGALFRVAEKVTRCFAPRTFNLCSIINAKSGACSENCRWCAQSRHWNVPGIPIYPVVAQDEIEAGAQRAESMGLMRYSLVTSGRKPSRRELRELCDRVKRLHQDHPSLEICVSLGLLNETDIAALAKAGVVRVHCNLETSERFFPQVCSSHTWQQKVQTLKACRAAGLEICSGALIGMGETLQDRIDLARALGQLHVPSIPINVLHPIPGTPLGSRAPLTDEVFLETVAIFRLLNPSAYLRFAGGRLQLSQETVRMARRIGINAAITGDFLTTCGATLLEDARAFVEAGYEAEPRISEALRALGTKCEN